MRSYRLSAVPEAKERAFYLRKGNAMKLTKEQKKILQSVAYLEKSASVTQSVASSMRLIYQDKFKLTGKQFYEQLGSFLFETTGRYSL